MTSPFPRLLLLCGFLAVAPAVRAGIIFQDDFSNNTPSIDNPVPLGWTIANTGSVDILGECNSILGEDLLPGHNCYVDLDGGTAQNGLLTQSLYLTSGHTYHAFFELAGNQSVPFLDTVFVQFGTSSAEFKIDPFEDFQPFSVSFVPAVSGTYNLTFLNSNLDDKGALLDNVRINQVPAPVPALGLAAAYRLRRRLRRRLSGRPAAGSKG